MNARKTSPDDRTANLADLLGDHRVCEVRRIETRLLIAGMIAAIPLSLVAIRVDGIKDLGGLVVLTALLFGLPAYFILMAGPTAWRDRVTTAGLPAACAATGLSTFDREGDASAALAAAGQLGLVPDYNAVEVAAGLTGTLDGVPTQLFDLTLTQTGGTGRRLAFKGVVIRFELPRPTGVTATVRPRGSAARRLLSSLSDAAVNTSVREAARGRVYTVRSDDPNGARAWITPEVLSTLADIGRSEGRRLDTTTFSSILAGLLTRDMGPKAVAAGMQNDAFYLAVDRRASLVRAPHPMTTPKTPDALTALWRKQIRRVLDPLRNVLATRPFRAKA